MNRHLNESVGFQMLFQSKVTSTEFQSNTNCYQENIAPLEELVGLSKTQ